MVCGCTFEIVASSFVLQLPVNKGLFQVPFSVDIYFQNQDSLTIWDVLWYTVVWWNKRLPVILMESHAHYPSLNFVPWGDEAICLLPMGIKLTLSGNEDPFVYDLAIKNVLCGFLYSIIFHSIAAEWGGHNSQSNRASQHSQYGHAESSTILQCHIWKAGFIV